MPGLYGRFKLIQELARTIMLLHSEGWLHKSIRGDNIMFLDYVDKEVLDFDSPYLVGFDYSRRTVDPSLRLNDQLWTNDIYRHPDRQGEPAVNFRKEHDYYALGAVLVEVGYWQSLSSLGKFAQYNKWWQEKEQHGPSKENRPPEWSPKEDIAVKEELIRLTEASQFRYNVGKVWKEVTLKCLTGDFGIVKDDDEQTQLQVAFREEVVQRLSSLSG